MKGAGLRLFGCMFVWLRTVF